MVLMAASLTVALTANAATVDKTDEEAAASEWKKSFELYFWLPRIYINTADDSDYFKLTLSDILRNLNFMTMIDFNAQKDKWSMGADMIYIHLTDKITSDPHPILDDPKAHIGMRAFISTFGGSYQFFDKGRTELYALAGVRYLYIRLPIEFDIDGAESFGVDLGGHNWNGVIGMRGKTTFNDKLYMDYYADLGTGQANNTYQIKVGGGYRHKYFTFTGGLRYLRFNFDSSSDLDNLRVIGPYIGAKWFF
jgi:hypothetical protein